MFLSSSCRSYAHSPKLTRFKRLPYHVLAAALVCLHPTGPILIRDIRMETTHENALLPWWPAGMARCSGAVRVCMCHTQIWRETHVQTHAVKAHGLNLMWGQKYQYQTCLMIQKRPQCVFHLPCRITHNTTQHTPLFCTDPILTTWNQPMNNNSSTGIREIMHERG